MENTETKQQIMHIIGNILGGFITPAEAVELIDKIYKQSK